MGIAMAAAVAVLTGAGAAIGIGMATSHASEAIARQPEAKKDIRSTMLIGCALAEATAIYGLLVAIMLIFVASPDSTSIMGAAVAVVTGMGAGIGIGLATSRACDSIARQPEVKKDNAYRLRIGRGNRHLRPACVNYADFCCINKPADKIKNHKKADGHMLNINIWDIVWMVVNLLIFFILLRISQILLVIIILNPISYC